MAFRFMSGNYRSQGVLQILVPREGEDNEFFFPNFFRDQKILDIHFLQVGL